MNMALQNFKSDFIIFKTFSRETDGEVIDVPVPGRLELVYFVDGFKSCYKASRKGDECINCSISEDGMSLSVYLKLSEACLGPGRLLEMMTEYIEDDTFPGGFRKVQTVRETEITLWTGNVDGGIVSEDAALLSKVAYGYSAYQLAVRNGFEGTEKEWLDSLIGTIATEHFVDVESEQTIGGVKTFSEVVHCSKGISLDGNKATDVAYPTTPSDAANMQYVKDHVASSITKESTRLSGLIKGNTDSISQLGDFDDRMKLLLGYNATRSIVNLKLGVSGKYVKCASRSAVANSSFAISKPFAVEACSELLIKTGFNPSDADHSGLDLTVIAIYEEIERQRTVQKKDAGGNPLYYVVTVDEESGSTTVTTDETTENTGYPVYTTETYTEQRYLPNNEDRFVAIPDSGYYVANIPQSCKVVISYKPGVSDTAVIVEKHGALANLISQVFGIYEHRTMVEAMVSLAARVDALESRQGLLGNATAGTLDVSELTKCLYPTILRGHGVPSAATIPDNLPEGLPWDGVPAFIGQFYINLDASSGGLYYAKGHDAVSDWKQA